MIPFPKIRQFRNVVRAVHDATRGVKPTLTFRGSVKLHGSNTAIVRHPDGTLTFQSRNREMSLDADHQYFVATMTERLGEDGIRTLLPDSDERVAVYGEWCGQGIQQGVAISTLPRMWVPFAALVGDDRWLPPEALEAIHSPAGRVFSIWRFPNWSVNIDFERPNAAREQLIEITRAVEERCPVSAALGAEGTGEGVVWRCTTPGFDGPEMWFKVKGTAHSATNVKTLAPADALRLESTDAFVSAALTEHRLQQGVDWLREQQLPLERSATGAFLRWLFKDIKDEEADTLEASGLSEKDVNPTIARKARRWFFTYLDENY